jgi:hypothetical protein
MAYASVTHVVAHHPARRTYTASTVPNLTEVAMYLDEAAADLDFSLAKAGYDSPLSSSVASAVKAYFQKANAMGALCMLESGAQQSHNRDDFCAMFREAKKMIEAGQIPGLDKNDDESLPRYSAGTPPYFTRDMEL